ncbi:MAG: CDP-archaeol synthase [Chitinophagales bacterium]
MRARTALFFVGTVLLAFYLNVWTYAVLIALVILFAQLELEKIFQLLRTKNNSSLLYLPLTLLLSLSSFILTLLIALGYLDMAYAVLIIPVLFIPFIVELWADSDQPLRNISFQLFAFIYVTLPMVLLNFIAIDPAGNYRHLLVIGIILIVWANDAAAYLVGSMIGKTKLFERISPKKTREGSMGGVLGSLIVGVLIHYVFGINTLQDWLILALILSISASLGDLIQSLIKRSVKIKDTGSLFPGHGGVLDRFDAFFFAIPFALVYVLFRF